MHEIPHVCPPSSQASVSHIGLRARDVRRLDAVVAERRSSIDKWRREGGTTPSVVVIPVECWTENCLLGACDFLETALCAGPSPAAFQIKTEQQA